MGRELQPLVDAPPAGAVHTTQLCRLVEDGVGPRDRAVARRQDDRRGVGGRASLDHFHFAFLWGIADHVVRHVSGKDEGPTEMAIFCPCMLWRS